MAIYNVLQSINILLENNPNKIQLPVSPITPKEFPKPEDLIKENQSSPSSSSNPQPRISIFGVVRRLREQRYHMVQSVSQYEFIYEYIIDYLSLNGIIKLKHPRNTFGLDDDEMELEQQIQ